jgi:hypothetical protein
VNPHSVNLSEPSDHHQGEHNQQDSRQESDQQLRAMLGRQPTTHDCHRGQNDGPHYLPLGHSLPALPDSLSIEYLLPVRKNCPPQEDAGSERNQHSDNQQQWAALHPYIMPGDWKANDARSVPFRASAF